MPDFALSTLERPLHMTLALSLPGLPGFWHAAPLAMGLPRAEISRNGAFLSLSLPAFE
ncbi:MAG: hypothetical protein ACKO6N_13790 [Myxococcota bacterium]